VGLNLKRDPQPPGSEAYKGTCISIESDEHVKSSTYVHKKPFLDFSWTAMNENINGKYKTGGF